MSDAAACLERSPGPPGARPAISWLAARFAATMGHNWTPASPGSVISNGEPSCQVASCVTLWRASRPLRLSQDIQRRCRNLSVRTEYISTTSMADQTSCTSTGWPSALDEGSRCRSEPSDRLSGRPHTSTMPSSEIASCGALVLGAELDLVVGRAARDHRVDVLGPLDDDVGDHRPCRSAASPRSRRRARRWCSARRPTPPNASASFTKSGSASM